MRAIPDMTRERLRRVVRVRCCGRDTIRSAGVCDCSLLPIVSRVVARLHVALAFSLLFPWWVLMFIKHIRCSSDTHRVSLCQQSSLYLESLLLPLQRPFLLVARHPAARVARFPN